MQAIILAAGMGKRLGRYTKDATKCMVEVNGKALIEYAIEALVKAKVSRTVLVVGYKADVLKNFIASKFNEKNLGGMKIEYIENKVYDTTNNIYSFYLARNELLKDENVDYLPNDLLFANGAVLAITNEMIFQIEKNLKTEIQQIDISDFSADAMFFSGNSNYDFLVEDKGLLLSYNIKKSEFKVLVNDEKAADYPVYSAYITDENKLYITSGGGLYIGTISDNKLINNSDEKEIIKLAYFYNENTNKSKKKMEPN